MRGGEPAELVLQADSSANLLCRLIGFLAQHDIRAPELRLENHGHVMCLHLCISGLPQAELLRVAEKMRNCIGVGRVDFH